MKMKHFRSPNNDINSMSDDDSDNELIYESDDPPVLLVNDEAPLNDIEIEEYVDESPPSGEQANGDQSDTDYSLTSDSEASEASDAGEGPSASGVPNGYEVGEDGAVRRVIEDYNEDEEDDEVIKAIISEIKKPRSKPPDIKTDDYVVDLSFHPQLDLLAVGTVAGDVVIYKYANEENIVKQSFEVHTKAVRCLEYSHDGKIIISTSRDKTIMITDCETGKLKRFWDDAHDEPVYSMHVLNENLFATGDDDGTLKLWDIRQRDSNAIFSLKEVDDHISCILTNDSAKYLLFTSGDGYLTTINIPGKKLYVQSEPYEEELTNMGIFRNKSKVIVSSSKGNFYTFNWGQFGYHCDAFSGPVAPVSKMMPITDRIAITGGEEGILRAMHLVPGRILGTVGQHTLAVEAMDISNNGELVASSSHDNDIRFWNIKYFETFDDIKYNEKSNKKKAMRHNLPSSKVANRGDFFADMAE